MFLRSICVNIRVRHEVITEQSGIQGRVEKEYILLLEKDVLLGQ